MRAATVVELAAKNGI
ncbi:MAG: hypothetical protein M3527_07035, partial [Actinomycetota bacterium]|nr:hypothetical protein [Actinomycetota bacterium]